MAGGAGSRPIGGPNGAMPMAPMGGGNVNPYSSGGPNNSANTQPRGIFGGTGGDNTAARLAALGLGAPAGQTPMQNSASIMANVSTPAYAQQMINRANYMRTAPSPVSAGMRPAPQFQPQIRPQMVQPAQPVQAPAQSEADMLRAYQERIANGGGGGSSWSSK